MAPWNSSLHRFLYPLGSKNQSTWIQRDVYIEATTGVDYMTQGDIDKMGPRYWTDGSVSTEG